MTQASKPKSKTKLFIIIALVLIAIAAIVAVLFNSNVFNDDATQTTTTTAAPNRDVELEVEVLMTGLENPWDIAFLPDETLLFTERQGLLSAYINNQKQLIGNIDGVVARGEGGLMGIAVDSDFEDNNYIYLCHNSRESGRLDVRVTRFVLNIESLSLEDPQAIVTGINSRYDGNHSGCRLQFSSQGHLWITTGDAKNQRNPQDPSSLAGKILRVDREGEGVSGNATGEFDERIFSYGHRNVQGIVLFDEPRESVFGFSAEHGPDVDDEINLLSRGNFGWDPGSGYNENVPMTDLEKFPNAIEPIWASGEPTLAISGIDIIRGNNWGRYNGALAVATLKAEHIMILFFNDDFEIRQEEKILENQGRIRSVALGPDSSLYVTTDNSEDDKILKITPKG